MDSLFDQSALVSLAERLLKAARAAGADAADAVAMRSVSQSVDVRDGAVEESQRAEGNDVGLRVMVGKKQAVVSTNDLSGDGVKALAERAVAMARVAPEDRYAGLADASLLAKSFPDLDLVDRDLPDTATLEKIARRAEDAGRAVKGVSKSGGASASAGIGGMVLLTSHGFSGAYLGSRHSVSMQAIAGEGTGMETDYDFSSALHATDLDDPEKIGQTAGEKAVAKLNPRKVSTRKVPVVFDRSVAGSIVGHLVSAINGSSIARKTSFLRDKMGERIFARGHQHHRRSAAQAGLAFAAVRRRGRRGPAHGVDRRRRAEDLDSRQRHRARARAGHHRPCRAERIVDAVAVADQPASRARQAQPRGADQGHRRRLLRHRPDRLRRQHGDRRLQPRRVGLLDREGPAHLSGERGDHRRSYVRHLPRARRRPTICTSATAPTRRRCGWKD